MAIRRRLRMLAGSVLMIGMMGISPIAVFAVEATEPEQMNEAVATETEALQSMEGITDTSAEEIQLSDDIPEQLTEEGRWEEAPSGDDIFVDALSVDRDEEHSCQINMTALMPDELRLDLFADVRNVSTHIVYRLPLYFDNEYTQRCFVEPGEYTVTNISVYGDSTGKYSFVYPEDFSLDENEAVDLFTMLSDEEIVQDELNERLGSGVDEDESAEADPWEGMTQKEELSVPSDYEVEHVGIGGGLVGIKGEPTREHEIVIRICRGGIPGIMTVEYSMDGEGGIWSEETAVPLAGNIRLYELGEHGEKDSGLTAYFSADPRDPENMFSEGDQFRAYIPDPDTELVIGHKGDGAAELKVRELVYGTHAFHLLYEGGYAIQMEVLRGGSYGEAVVRISTDGGKSFMEQMLLPEDGIISLPEIGVELVFTGTDNASLFVEGDIYTVDAIKEDYTVLIIGVTVFLLIAGGILYGLFRRYMLRQLPGASEYRIEPYIPYAEREKQHI